MTSPPPTYLHGSEAKVKQSFELTIMKILHICSSALRFRAFSGILLFITFCSPLDFASLIVLRNAIESHRLSSHSPLRFLVLHSNLLENHSEIPRNQFIEPTLSL